MDLNEILDLSVQEGLFKPEIITATIVFITVIIFECVFIHKRHKRDFKSKHKQKVEKAKELGHIIIANRVSMSYTDKHIEDKLSDRIYSARYEYEIDGIHGRKVIINKGSEPPEQITLYYGNTVNDVFTADDPADVGGFVLFYLLPIVAMLIVVFLFKFVFKV